MAGLIRLCVAIALAALLYAPGNGLAQVRAQDSAPQADPAVWGIYARLVGTEWTPDPGSVMEPLRWTWGRGEQAGSIIESGAPGTGTYIIKPGLEPGTLTSDFSRGIHHYRGTIAADGSVLWIRNGWIKKAHQVSLVDSKIRLDIVKVKDDQVTEVQATYLYGNADGSAAPVELARDAVAEPAARVAAAPATRPAAAPVPSQPAGRRVTAMPGIPEGAIPATPEQVAAALAARDVVLTGDEKAIRSFLSLPSDSTPRHLRWSILGVQALGGQDLARTAWVVPGRTLSVVVPHLRGWDLLVKYRNGKPIEALAQAWPLDPARFGIYSRLVGHYARTFNPAGYYAWKVSPTGQIVEYVVSDGQGAGIWSVITELPVPGQLGRIQGSDGEYRTSAGVVQSDGRVLWTPFRDSRKEQWSVAGDQLVVPELNLSQDKRLDARRIYRGFFHDMMEKVQGGDDRVARMAARMPAVMQVDLVHYAKVQERIRSRQASSDRYDRFNSAMGALNSALTAADKEADASLRRTELDDAATMGALRAQAAAERAAPAGNAARASTPEVEGRATARPGLVIEDADLPAAPSPAPAMAGTGRVAQKHLRCMVLDFGSEFTSKPGAIFVSAPAMVQLVDGRVPAGIRERYHGTVKARYSAGGSAYCSTGDARSDLDRLRRDWFAAHPNFEHVTTGISPL